MDDMIKRFVTLYEPSFGLEPWHNITEVAEKLNYLDFTSQTTAEYMDVHGINRQWTREMVEAATRVNYAQDVDKVQALIGFVSLAATGASSVAGGNWQIFQNFVERSKANVHLNTTVRLHPLKA